MPKHLYDPKSSSMIETSHVQKMPQRFDRGFGEETHEKRFHREADGSDHFKTPTDDMEDSRRRDSRFDRDDKKNNQVPTMTAEELRLKAEAREARAKAKLERPPRTAGVLYRYDESGALERVLTEAEKKEIAEKEEARKVAKENREKQFKLMEKKKFDKFATSKSSASSKEEIIPNPGSAEHVSENADAPRVEKESENPKDTDTQDVPTTSDEGVSASEPHDNDASAPELDLEQLEISSDDARQQSVEFVEVKSKRTISQERKEVKGNTSLIVTPPTPSVPPRVSDKVSQKKSTIEVIPPTEDSSRQVVSNLAPSKPAWQAPQATLEVLGVPSPATASESVPPSVEDIESKIDLEKNEKKDRVKHKERDGSKYRRKKEDETDDQNAQVSRRGTGRVDTSAVNMHLLRNNTTSSRQRSSRPENQEKVHEKEDEKLEVSAKVESMPSTSSAEEKLESQDSKVSEESVDEQPETDTSPSTSGRGRGRGNSRGRGGRRGGLGRREVRFSPRTPDSLQEDGSAENPDDANEPSRASWGSSRGRGRGGGDRESARKGFKARGPPLSRERITRGPPAYSPNPE